MMEEKKRGEDGRGPEYFLIVLLRKSIQDAGGEGGGLERI